MWIRIHRRLTIKKIPAPTVHKPVLQIQSMSLKATPAATDTKQALPETGENTSLLATYWGGLDDMVGLGLAGKRKKKTKIVHRLGSLNI